MLERLIAGRRTIIDLHGCSVSETKQLIQDQLKNVSCTNLTELYIITGWGKHVNSEGGRGVLKKILPKLLKPYQLEIAAIQEEKGAYKVILTQSIQAQTLSREFFDILAMATTGGDSTRLIQKTESKAAQGDIEALLLLSWVHLYHNVPDYSDPSHGLTLLEQARNRDSLDASVCLGELYREGLRVKRDDKKAFNYFKEAAEGDYIPGQYGLGVCYLSGQGVKRDDKKGLFWVKKAADAGLAHAQCTLGESYFKGDFTPEDFALSLDYMRRAAHQNLTAAQVHLGRCYGAGCYGVEQNYYQAFHYYWLAAQAEDVFAMYQVASYLLKGHLGKRDAVSAFPWLLKCAQRGDVDGQAAVAVHYFFGDGISQNTEEGILWCQKALEQGSEVADWLMSHAYLAGKGVEQNPHKAFEHLIKSANKGHEVAKMELEKLNTYQQKLTVIHSEYSVVGKIKIADTTLIRWLNKKTALTFFGICDRDYQVDAITEVLSPMAEKKAQDLQSQLGLGQFFTLANKKHFVLEGINLPENESPVGHAIQRLLK